MEAREDYQGICDCLLETLKKTGACFDLISLTYFHGYKGDPNTDVVEAKFPAGVKVINVSWDSGIAMIRDVMKHVY